MSEKKHLTLAVGDLSDHPLLAHIPTWKREEPEFTALVESIRDHGLDYEILIDSECRIIDGRNRRNALAVLNQPVPCVQVDAGQAASVIVASLINRRHLSKGALAYLAAPLFDDVLIELKARRAASISQSRIPASALSALAVKSTEDIAAQMGVSPRLFDQAIRLHAMFKELGEDVRAKYEPRLLGSWVDADGDVQDAIGLGYMINGLTSMIEEDAGKKKNLGKRSEHDRLFVSFFPKLKLHWSKASEEQRVHIAEQTKTEVLKWPAELRAEIASALKAAAKAEQE